LITKAKLIENAASANRNFALGQPPRQNECFLNVCAWGGYPNARRERPKRPKTDRDDFSPLPFFWLLRARNGKNLSNPIVSWPTLSAINPLASFAFLIATVQCLVAAFTTRDNLHLRPALARQSMAARLRSGIIVLQTFLRRLIILMALEL
jgi:hypothetical protein